MDNTLNPTIVKPKARFHRYDVVMKKSTNTKHIILRGDGKLSRDINGEWSLSNGDRWSEYSADIIAHLDADIANLGYIEL